MRNLIKYLLLNRMDLPAEHWEAQGFGFLRLRVGPNTRLHVWDTRLRTPGVSDIHDHTQWAFKSRIISGSIINTRYNVLPHDKGHFIQATLNCGIGGGMVAGSKERVDLTPLMPELYLPGSEYRQGPDEVHRTYASDGTVTLLQQERRECGTARVFYPFGSEWGDAIPRVATRDEVSEVGGFALSVFGERS